MGKVEKFVKKHEKEKHTTTEEFIETLKWYIQEMAKLDAEHTRAKNDLVEALNTKVQELKERAKAEAGK